ncbi:MFS transporter [Nonomuraea endophytica]|uniref:MFS family permease n=1 Tax=Nonomuraea endophytica TaxID=714136 RepID=A0A7W8EH17_9ACTN|nr:MFS transporter [Nonomuraea endophytica]MBB5079134.1 MFS family permease [Nonomuraea endophytica]
MAGRGTIMLSYGLTGVMNALWGATLPATDARLELGPGRLGGLLMALAVGALVAMPVAGRLAERWTGRRLLRICAPAAALGLAGPALAGGVETLMISAVVLGMLFGLLNVALSLQAAAVERSLARPIMATVHGTWTLGAVAGGAVITAALRAGLDVRVLMGAGAIILALALLGVKGTPDPRLRLVPQPAEHARPAPPRPGLMVMLGVVGAAAFITEGAATDWAGVHATRVLGADPATGSLVYTVFFVAMTLVRFAGDALRTRLGVRTTIRLCGVTATAGYGLVLLAGVLPFGAAARVGCAMAGWALAGAGMAVVWPIVASLLGAADGAARRLSAVTTISYGGGLVGPALIGYVATAATLPLALVIPAALALLVATAAPPLLNAVSVSATRNRPIAATTSRSTS